MSNPLNRKPWPMKWVVLVIIACIVPYTVLSLKYRKPGPAYEPYEDTKQRANVLRLLEAGYQRIKVVADRPADPQLIVRTMKTLVNAKPTAGGLPEKLATTLVEIPELPVSFSSVKASAENAATQPYPIVFTCLLNDQKHQLGGAEVFLNGQDVVIVPQFEPLDGSLTARTKDSSVAITLPANALKPGQYTLHLAARDQSREWVLTVR